MLSSILYVKREQYYRQGPLATAHPLLLRGLLLGIVLSKYLSIADLRRT